MIKEYIYKSQFEEDVKKGTESFPLVGIIDKDVYVSDGHAVDRSVNAPFMDYLYDNTLCENKNYMTFKEASQVEKFPTSLRYNTEIISLRELKYFTKITKITERYLFADCPNLEEVDLSNITSVESGVFQNCPKLKRVYNSQNIQSSSYSVFQNCSSLEVIVLHNRFNVGQNNAFSGCASLREIKSPLGFFEKLFVVDGCTSLKSIHFCIVDLQNWGNTVDNIFRNCISLDYVIIEDPFPPAFTANTFSNIGKTGVYFFVPDISYEAYMQAWGSIIGNTAIIKKISDFKQYFQDVNENFYFLH